MKLSVIVPMYNVSAYVGECLDSLVHQTYTDMEIIVVDDGCTDNSCAIVEEFVKNYTNVTLLHKKNGGLSDARNYAIPYAKGEYIAFLDSDDFADITLYEKMMSKIDEGHDVVVCDITYYYENKEKNFIMQGLSSWNIENIRKRAMVSPMFAWNKVYKASFFKEKGYRYPLGLWYEDIPVTLPIFASCNSIGWVHESLINYRQREGSIMSETKTQRLKEIFTIMEMVRTTFKKEGWYDTYQKELEYLHIEHLRLYGMFRFIRSNIWKELYDMSDKCMNEHFPSWKKNGYISYLGFKNKMFLKYYSKQTAALFHLLIK